MIANVGPVDRVVRITVGLALMSPLALLHSPIRWVGLIGFIPVLTALFGFCPLYAALGLTPVHATKAPEKGEPGRQRKSRDQGAPTWPKY